MTYLRDKHSRSRVLVQSNYGYGLALISYTALPFLLCLLFVASVKASEFHDPELSNLNDYKQHFVTLGKEILHSLGGDDLTAYFGFSPSIEIVQSNTPNAFAMAPGTLLLSTELCNQFVSESEYAFVIAHEIAHLILHSHADHSLHSVSKELEADAYALRLLQQAGFNHLAGIKLLERLKDSRLETSKESIELRLVSMEVYSSETNGLQTYS